MANNNKALVFQAMEELAYKLIALRGSSRLVQISYVRIFQEMMYSIFRLVKSHPCVHLTGSMNEGIPQWCCNDRDQMQNYEIFPSVVLAQPPEKKDKFTWGYVIAEPSTSEPAFLRLKAVDPMCLHPKVRTAVDKDGYLNTADFLKANEPTVNIDSYQMHGPAYTFDPPKGTVINGLDIVLCLNCKVWPSVSECFFTRERLNNLPTIVLERILNAGCSIVGVGHPSSASKDIEWRWSFSVAEKELIQKMSGSMPNCMLTLKALKRKYINYEESDGPTPFCSYFIKTACLWVYDTFPHENYSSMDLIRTLLKWLIDCYQRGNLPHYFIPSQNLIGHLSKETCDEVQEKLKTVNSPNLWKMVMSCVGNNAFKLVNSMCDKLEITNVSEGDDYQQLETNLLNHPRAKEEIENAIRKIPHRGSIDLHYYMDIVSNLSNEYQSLINVLQRLLENKVETSMIFALPELVILPIIDTIDEFVLDGHGQMFKQTLYRHLGDVYTYLLAYFLRSKCESVISESVRSACIRYQDRPIHYYRLGAELVFPDKWSDRGQGGLIREAKYHYVMGNYETLKTVLTRIEPLVQYTKTHVYCMNTHINIQINSRFYLVLDSWSADKKLKNLALVSGNMFYLHPVVFVFYMQAVVALKEGNMEKASSYLNDMKECATKIVKPEVKDNSMSLIKIIENDIKAPKQKLLM